MTKDEAVRIKQSLPHGTLLPGTMIQIQETVPGGGEQIEITVDTLKSVTALVSMESGSCQRIVEYRTLGGLRLTFDRVDKQWRRVRQYANDHFGHNDPAMLVWVFPL